MSDPKKSFDPEDDNEDYIENDQEAPNAQNTAEEPEYEDDDEVDPNATLDPDNPLLARVQEAIYRQLQTANDRVTTDLKDRQELLKKVKKEREDLGVGLYNVQQQLAKEQLQLERQHDVLNAATKGRIQFEKDLESYREALTSKQESITELQKTRMKYQTELDKLSSSLRSVEEYNEEVKNQIAVTRRETYKAEEDVTNLEKIKKTQDVLIDNLNEQLKQLHDQYALYEAQLIAQRQETKAAAETLAAAALEIEALQYEMKQLVMQWKGSLLGVTRRDEALQQTEDALNKQFEIQLAYDSEIRGYKHTIKLEQEKNEKLTSVQNKIRNEISFLEKQIKINNDRRERLNDEYMMLKKSLDQTDNELQKIMMEKNRIREEMNLIQKNMQQLQDEVHKLEEQIAGNINSQTTLLKSKQSTEQGTKKLGGNIREKEMESAEVQNELSRIRVDALNTRSHIEQLKDHLQQLLKELKERDKMIERCELEIRRRNDDIEKKQSEVDRLNKKFDQLVSSMEDENLGPLEATIHNLTKSIMSTEHECSTLQHNWIKRQTELVDLINEGNAQVEKNAEMKSRHTILKQRRMRMDTAVENHEKEIREIESSIRLLQTDMQKLNVLIAKNIETQKFLTEGNLDMETMIVGKLKDHESESIQLQTAVETIKEEKAIIMADLIEAERQLMLWERKIQLERETQEAIDPEQGAAETKGMRKEIHRMSLRYQQLQNKQEMLIQGMEKAINRRETIMTKNRIAQKSGKGAGTTQVSLQQEITEVSKKLKQTMHEIGLCDKEIRSLVSAQEQLGREVEDTANICNSMRRQEQDLLRSLEASTHQRNKNMNDIMRYQRIAKRYTAVESGKYQMCSKDVDADLTKQDDRLRRIEHVLKVLCEEFPQVKEDMERIILTIKETAI